MKLAIVAMDEGTALVRLGRGLCSERAA